MKVSAMRRLLRGDASSFINDIESLHSSDKVILCCRVSRCAQRERGNLKDQEANLRQAMKLLSVDVVDVVTHVGSGADPSWLTRAAHKAEKTNAALVAETTDRFIRHPGYHSKENPNAQARDCDLEELAWCTGGVMLVTLLPPDALPGQVRSFHTARGQVQKSQKGGRPRTHPRGYKKQRRSSSLAKASWMRRCGLSIRRIAELLKTPKTTVQDWIRNSP